MRYINVLERDRTQNRCPLLLIALCVKVCYWKRIQQKWILVLRENAQRSEERARYRHESPSASV
jgi:hypothetical protein